MLWLAVIRAATASEALRWPALSPPLHFAFWQIKKQILPASVSFLLLLFGSHAYTVPGLSSHCSLSIDFRLFDSAAELKSDSIQQQ